MCAAFNRVENDLVAIQKLLRPWLKSGIELRKRRYSGDIELKWDRGWLVTPWTLMVVAAKYSLGIGATAVRVDGCLGCSCDAQITQRPAGTICAT